MNDYSWQEQRKDIERELRQHFDVDIDITPRALAALQTGYTNQPYEFGPSVSEINIFESLLKSSPACVAALLKSGIVIENINFPSIITQPAPIEYHVFGDLFAGVNSDYYVNRYSEIKRNRRLTEIDILISVLEASIQGAEPNITGSAILKAAGIKMPSTIRGKSLCDLEIWEECDEYLTSITKEVSYLTTIDPSHSLIQFALFEDQTGTISLPYTFNEKKG